MKTLPFLFAFPLLFLISCSLPNMAIYSTDKQNDVGESRQSDKPSKQFSVQFYQDSLFPNDVVLQYPEMETLSIFMHPRMQPDRNVRPFEFDTTKLAQLTNLKEVSFYYFYGREFPTELAHLPNLERIYFLQGALKELPKDLSGFQKLKILDLTKNEIEEISDATVPAPQLESLTLDNNFLKHVSVDYVKAPC